MCQLEGAGALLAFGAYKIAQDFIPTPSTPDLQTIWDALNMPDANKWCTTMDIEIKNMHCLNIFKTVPCLPNMNIITLQWVFHWKFENGALIKHKACLVVQGFTQTLGVDYNKAHLYAPVMRLKSFQVLLSIDAWFDLDLHQFDISAAYLHGEINGEVYMELPPGHRDGHSIWKLLKGLYSLKQAGRIWHERLKADMEELGYAQCQRDYAMFRIGTWKTGDWPCVHFGLMTRLALGPMNSWTMLRICSAGNTGYWARGSYIGCWG